MANQLTVKLPAVPMKGETDVVFKIKIAGQMLGHLTVTKDMLSWTAAKIGKGATSEVSWVAFDEWMRAWQTLKG